MVTPDASEFRHSTIHCVYAATARQCRAEHVLETSDWAR
jgi:hypothetical protein